MLQKKLVRVISSKKLVIFFCRRFSSIQNSSISSGEQYLSKREVRRLSVAINIIPPSLSFLFLFLSNWVWFKARLKFQLIRISNTAGRAGEHFLFLLLESRSYQNSPIPEIRFFAKLMDPPLFICRPYSFTCDSSLISWQMQSQSVEFMLRL